MTIYALSAGWLIGEQKFVFAVADQRDVDDYFYFKDAKSKAKET